MLSFHEVVKAAKGAIAESLEMLPGATDAERKEWCEKVLMVLLTDAEDLVPMVELIIETPIVKDIVEEVERNAIKALVEWSWAAIEKDVE